MRWKWTNDGWYTSKSAYAVQFAGSYCTFNCNTIWEAKVEGKHRFFAWAWWNNSFAGLNKYTRKMVASLLIYVTWNIWKEHNRRVFQNQAALPARVVALIKEEIKLRQDACGGALVF
ncbi:hypothetical protein HU200_043764 [Digitaria exilis]|uniref:Reverse transcriptase zinc-binding domain-containing protein n=1 Tax=Digitaria exilis TaxID=1010633 RepID=A0A835BAI2_9POAL|nr:hypothetical protein HU200_043764 [Digitaria exilis]